MTCRVTLLPSVSTLNSVRACTSMRIQFSNTPFRMPD
jgi:hypothetical protein